MKINQNQNRQHRAKSYSSGMGIFKFVEAKYSPSKRGVVKTPHENNIIDTSSRRSYVQFDFDNDEIKKNWKKQRKKFNLQKEKMKNKNKNQMHGNY